MTKLSMMKEMSNTYCTLSNNNIFTAQTEKFFKRFMEYRYIGIAKISKSDIKDLYDFSKTLKA